MSEHYKLPSNEKENNGLQPKPKKQRPNGDFVTLSFVQEGAVPIDPPLPSRTTPDTIQSNDNAVKTTLQPSSINVVKLGYHVVDGRLVSFWNTVIPSRLYKPEDTDIVKMFRQHCQAIYHQVDHRHEALNVLTFVSRNEIQLKGFLLSENKNAVVYFYGDISQGRGKIGSTGNGRVRESIYHEQLKEGENDLAVDVAKAAAVRIIDIDNFDPDTDQVIQKMVIDLAKRFSFSSSQLPIRLELGKPVNNSSSLPIALQIFMHSLVYDIDTSPQLGGGKQMKSFLKAWMKLVLEVGAQEAFDLSHHNHSMQEFLAFDHEAYNIHVNVANKVAIQIYDTLISMIGQDRLQAISCNIICIMSWPPRVPRGMIEMTPLLESIVHGNVLYDVDIDYQNCDSDAKIQNLFKRAPRGNDPYQPDYLEWEKQEARESLQRVLLACDQKGAILNIDSNKVAFPDVDVIENGKVVRTVLGVANFLEEQHGYKLIANLSGIPVRKGKLIDTLHVYVKNPPKGGGKLCVAIIHPPWCRLGNSNQRYHVEPMESCQIAIMAEAIRKFHQLARTGTMSLDEDKLLFSPNIPKAYLVKEFFVNALHINPIYANTILKTLLSQFNALSPRFHQMTKRESLYLASNNRNYEAKALKILTKDPNHFVTDRRSNDAMWSLTFRRILSKATNQKDLDLYIEQALYYLRYDVSPTTASWRFSQIKETQLITGDLFRRFENKYNETKDNAGNTSNHRGQSLFQTKSNDIFIHEKVQTGEAFWVKYKALNDSDQQEQDQLQLEVGQMVQHEHTNMPYFYFDVSEQQYKCIRFKTNPIVFFEGMIYSSLCKNYFLPKKKKQNNTSQYSCRNYSESHVVEPVWKSGNVPLVVNNFALVRIVPKMDSGPSSSSAVSSRARKGANDRRFLLNHAASGKPFWIRRPPSDCLIGAKAKVYGKGEEILDRDGNSILYGNSTLRFLTNPEMNNIFEDIYPMSGKHYVSLRNQNFGPPNSANRHQDKSVCFYGSHTLETFKDSAGRLVVCNNMILCWIVKLPTKQELLNKKLSFFDCTASVTTATATATATTATKVKPASLSGKKAEAKVTKQSSLTSFVSKAKAKASGTEKKADHNEVIDLISSDESMN